MCREDVLDRRWDGWLMALYGGDVHTSTVLGAWYGQAEIDCFAPRYTPWDLRCLMRQGGINRS